MTSFGDEGLSQEHEPIPGTSCGARDVSGVHQRLSPLGSGEAWENPVRLTLRWNFRVLFLNYSCFCFLSCRLFPGVKAAGISVALLLLAEPPEAVALGVPLSLLPISSHLPRLTGEGSQTLPLCKLHFFLIQSKSFETFHGSFSFFMSYICTSAPTLCQGTGVFNQKDCQES